MRNAVYYRNGGLDHTFSDMKLPHLYSPAEKGSV